MSEVFKFEVSISLHDEIYVVDIIAPHNEGSCFAKHENLYEAMSLALDEHIIVLAEVENLTRTQLRNPSAYI